MVGEAGLIRTKVDTKMVKDQIEDKKEYDLVLVSAPARATLEQPFSIGLRVRSRSSKMFELRWVLITFSDSPRLHDQFCNYFDYLLLFKTASVIGLVVLAFIRRLQMIKEKMATILPCGLSNRVPKLTDTHVRIRKYDRQLYLSIRIFSVLGHV